MRQIPAHCGLQSQGNFEQPVAIFQALVELYMRLKPRGLLNEDTACQPRDLHELYRPKMHN